MTLEEYFKDCRARGIIDHSIRHQTNEDGKISFYIHPARESGSTADFVLVKDNLLVEGPWQKENTYV